MVDISINGDMYLLFLVAWLTVSMIVDIVRIVRHFMQSRRDKGKVSVGRQVISLTTILEDDDMTDSEKLAYLKQLMEILDDKE